MILVDSSVWIDYFRGTDTPESDCLDRLLGRQPLALGDLILTEVLQGFRSDADFSTAHQLLTPFPVLSLGGAERALQAAQHFRGLRARGITVRKTIDTMIATFCIAEGMPLLYSDRDFDPFVAHLGLLSALPRH